MKHFIPIAALSAALSSAPAFADDSQTLLIKDFIGTVTITTGESFSLSGETDGINTVRENGLIIDGNETIDDSYCKSVNGNIELSIGKKSWFKRIGGYKNLNEYPQLDITVPENTELKIRDSVIFGTGETFGSVDAHVKSCGDIKIGDVNGPLNLRVSGSSDFEAGHIGTASVKISGSGDVSLGDMKSAVLNVSGSGNLDGGNVIGAAKLTSTGSGNIDLGEINGDLVYEGRGSSNLSLERLDGRASVTMSGSGNVDIDDGEIPDLMISSRGSSAFDFGGTAGDAAVIVSGSGDVDIDDATGTRDVKSSGSAAVKIGTKRYDH